MWIRGLVMLALTLLSAAGLLSDASAAHAPAAHSTAPQSPRPRPTERHAIKTVFLILMENHNWSDIKGNPSAPYINHTLLPRAAHAEQYYNPPGNHPSLPNYLWLEAGTNFGIGDDDDPSAHHLGTTHHLVSLLHRVGISWKAYQEGSSGMACPLTGNDSYAPRHDPFVYFDDVTGGNNPRSAYCIAHVRPYTQLARDLRYNTVARYNFITPSVCDDMHDTCGPLHDSVKQGDTWLSRQVPLILHSQAYKRGGALFITWDEGSDHSDGPIGLLVLSPVAKGHGYANTIHYTHSSTLRTLEEIFGVKPLLGDAAHATDLRNLFTTFP
jgi:hypothetical protein